MANDNQLQVDIVFSPEKAKAQIAAAMAEIGAADIQATTKTVRTKEEIFAKSREKVKSRSRPGR